MKEEVRSFEKKEKSNSIELIRDNSFDFLKMILGTIFGVLFFVVPFKINGEMTILYSLISKQVVSAIGIVPIIAILITTLSAVFAAYFTLARKSLDNEFFNELFIVSPFSLLIRIGAAIIAICVYFEAGHEYIYSSYTGGLIVLELIPSLYGLFFIAFIFIPFLLDFGGMELMGTLFKPIFKPLFRLPGMTAVVALGSWIGSGTVGILSADMEYKKGRLAPREACTLIFGFCTIALPSTFIYTTAIGGLEVSTFPAFYLTLMLCGVITSVIICRIPPISKKSAECLRDEGEVIKKDFDNTSGIEAAIKKASATPGFSAMLKSGCKKSIFMYIEAFPSIIFIATITLIMAEYTSVFNVLATPFTPILNAIGLPEASQAAPSFIIGFADLLLPFLGAATISSQLTKFVICIVGVIQVICLSETGAILLKTDIPVTIKDLVVVVALKTIITIPIALVIGRLIGLT